MKKRIGFMIKIIICFLIIMSITGCWNRRELDKLNIVMGTGVDKAMEPGKVQVVTQIVKPGGLKAASKDHDGGGGDAYFNQKSTGDLVFGGIRQSTHDTSRKLFYQHDQVLVLGKDIAEEGVQRYLDFFARDHEVRLTAYILVSKGTAEGVFEVKPEQDKIPAVKIAHLIEAQGATSETPAIQLRYFLARMMSKTAAPIAPLIEVMNRGTEKTVRVAGTAVFKQGRWVGQLDNAETRGLLWVIDEVKSGIIEVDCPDGNHKVGLEIYHAQSNIIPEIQDNKIYIKVKIHEEGNIGEQQCPENLVTPPAFEFLKKEKAAVIEGEIRAALHKARELNSDIFGFGEAIHQHYPKEWKDLEKRWDEIFPSIDVEIMVETEIRASGQITKPVRSQ